MIEHGPMSVSSTLHNDLTHHCEVLVAEIQNAYNMTQETMDRTKRTESVEHSSAGISYVMKFVLKTMQIEIPPGRFINARTFLPNETFRSSKVGHCKPVTGDIGPSFYLELPVKCLAETCLRKCPEYQENLVGVREFIRGRVFYILKNQL